MQQEKHQPMTWPSCLPAGAVLVPPGANAMKHLQARFTNFEVQVNFLNSLLINMVVTLNLFMDAFTIKY